MPKFNCPVPLCPEACVSFITCLLLHFKHEYVGVHIFPLDGRIIFNLQKLKTPSTEDEIVEIVKNAYNDNHKIRVVAAGHSWSQIAQTEDIMISLHDYSGLEEVDKVNKLVTVKAGTRLEHLSSLLEEHNLAMINLGSVARQSIAGAMSTGR